MLEFVKGDMFDAPADIRVNTVNCVGVMGAGVALAFKQRYPEMFKEYQRDCKDGRVTPGTMHVWKPLTGDWIINFPTKRDWREPSRYEDIDAGLDDLRSYLDGFGPVTVALPALGCGHGGLDWERVSRMISDKLDGVDAHVLVFEPAASRQAGRTATENSNEDERKKAERLGYNLVERDSLPGLEAPGPLYVLGGPQALSRRWIGLLPSRNPGERELQALQAIAAELSRSTVGETVALVYGTRASEDLAEIFLRQGVDVVMLLPFGVLTRKALTKQTGRDGVGSLSFASAAPANGNWSRQLFAQTMEMLRQNAEALLLSDPEPEWLASKGLAKWGQTPISYVRYETTPAAMRDALGRAGARPIGRRGEEGAPNIDFLIGKDSATTALGDRAVAKLSSAPAEAPNISTTDDALLPGAILTLTLLEGMETKRREILDTLAQLSTIQVDLTVTLSPNASEADRQHLVELGFTTFKISDAIEPTAGFRHHDRDFE
ncbi:macro domain-containing protein [Rhizobium sp. 2YAF20]|uniref:macro domain-containing protein n=1 Tax=Rhizobium sp. 2YAF20 TaxID=3233027 RepID=UPI003F97573B